MLSLSFFSRSLSIGLLFCALVGCSTYQEPTGYKYFPEYGWLPVIENAHKRNELYKSEMLVSYVGSDWHQREDGSLDMWTVRRPMLPATEAEAKRIVERNLSISRNASDKELAKMIISAPVLMPALAIMWTPPIAWIIESSEHGKPIGAATSDVTHDGKQEINHNASDASVNQVTVPTQGGVEVHVTDRSGIRFHRLILW